jgi:S1-C subfamily serine protease
MAGPDRRAGRTTRFVLATLALLLAGAGTTSAGTAPQSSRHALASEPSPSGHVLGGFDPDTLEKIAEKALPAVVLIDVRTATGSRQGSGFLVEPGGRILTNHHVIRDAVSARVKLASGDVYDRVSVLAADERRDIAVIQISGFDLPVLVLGNSDSVRIGAPVVAIGSPLGLENTLSTGVLSGRRQEPQGFHLFQISAPASSGSSGGPVLSRAGEVIAIATSQMPGGQNLNFAVPINYARGILGHLGPEPVAVLTAETAPPRGETEALSDRTGEVNRALRFDLDAFAGYEARFEGTDGEQRTSRTRVTYRRIERVGEGEPRIERYEESETTEPIGPFDAPQTVRRERSRTIVTAGDLRPVSARGETAWWTGADWVRAEYDLRFDGNRVRGVIRDSTRTAREIDRDLPPGILLRAMGELAFATLAVDSLVGRSVELETFDASSGELTVERYDLLSVTEVRVADRAYQALKVNVASGLSNSTAYFRQERPRVLLSIEGDGESDKRVMTGLELFGASSD